MRNRVRLESLIKASFSYRTSGLDAHSSPSPLVTLSFLYIITPLPSSCPLSSPASRSTSCFAPTSATRSPSVLPFVTRWTACLCVVGVVILREGPLAWSGLGRMARQRLRSNQPLRQRRSRFPSTYQRMAKCSSNGIYCRAAELIYIFLFFFATLWTCECQAAVWARKC